MSLQEEILQTFRDYPDFPKPGVVFKDICPILQNPALFSKIVDALADSAKGAQCIVGLESRGFLLGVPVALKLGVPFIPARKKGKLPGKVRGRSYGLEYGSDVLELQEEAFVPGQKVWVIDDVLATGGTAAAVGGLIESLGATVMGYGVLLSLDFLNGREKVLAATPRAPVQALVALH